MKIRSHLMSMVVVALFPVLAFSAVLVVTLWTQQQRAVEQANLGNVRALVLALDGEVRAAIRRLTALGLDEQFTQETPGSFATRARHVLATQPGWLAIVHHAVGTPGATSVARTVHDPGGGYIEPQLLERVIRSGLPGVSDLVTLQPAGIPATQIAVPVLRGNAVTHVLVANIEAHTWVEFFRAFPEPSGSVIGVVDSRRVNVARTLNPESSVGQAPSASIVAALARGPEGTFENLPGLEGQRLQSAHSRSPVTGWSIILSVPAEVVGEALIGPTVGLAIAGIVAALLALGLAAFLSQRIARPVAGLAEASRALSVDEAVHLPPSGAIDEVVHAHAAFRDASALLHEREAALNTAIDRERVARELAERANRAKDEFLAMLGHELRNPLNAVTAAIAVIDRVEPGSEPAIHAREVALRQSRHLKDLVDDLLDVARVTSGKIVLDRHVIDLAETVRRALGTLTAAGRLARHTVKTELDAAWTFADETRVEQIAVNLVENAVKYTPPGGTIGLRVARRGAEAELEVSDTGEGIAADLLPHIFELFTQGERTIDRAQGGLGLGLTLVRNLAELHGGRVTAASEGPGRGARFTLHLPGVEAPPRAPSAPSTPATKPVGTRVLVIEDNPYGRETLRTLLEIQGHEAHAAEDGPSGFAAALAVRPRVAIIDIGLPGYDGYEVARRIRASELGTSVRLIALTGYGLPEDRRAAAAAGFDAFLVKPVDFEVLERLLAP